MKIIYNNTIPVKGYLAMVLFEWIFVRNEVKTKSKYYQEIVLRHEKIHVKQYRELLYILFLVWYVLEYLVKLLFSFNFKKAYKSISFEQEANYHEADNDYENNRKHYSWLKYVFKMRD